MDSEPQLSPQTRRDRRVTILLTILCQSFQAVSLGGIALLLPIIRQDMGLSFTQGGSLAAAATLIYALMQIPAGYLSDRFSPKRLFVIGILGTTVLTLSLGLVSNYTQALINQVFAGFFRALLFTPGMALLTGWFSPKRRATATGLYLIGGASGSVIFNILGPLIVALSNWRVSFISVSAMGIICSLILLRFGKESPTQPPRQKRNMLEALQFFRYRMMWVIAGVQFIRLATMQSTLFWLPSLLVNEKGLQLQYAGFIVAMQAILMAPSNVLGGYVSDRLKNPALVIGISFTVLAMTSLLLVSVRDMTWLVAVVIINAIFLQMHFGPMFSIPVELMGVKKAGIITGFGNFFANIGAFTATFVMGAIKDNTGAFQNGFYLISGACVTGVLLTLLLTKLRHQAKAAIAVE